MPEQRPGPDTAMTDTTVSAAELRELKRREVRNASRRLLRSQLEDQRTRISRIKKVIEHQLRAELERRGRAITYRAELLIADVAIAETQLQVVAAQASRGMATDAEQLTRLQNNKRRALNALGLATEALAPRPTLREHLRRRHEAAQAGEGAQ
jgi:hypothetical protein